MNVNFEKTDQVNGLLTVAFVEDDYKATLTGLQKDGPDSMVTAFGCRPDYAYIECGRCIQTWGIQSIPIPE